MKNFTDIEKAVLIGLNKFETLEATIKIGKL